MSRCTIAARKQEKLRDRIRDFAKQKHNKRCFDCQRQGPHSNVILSPYNIFVCNQCSGLHRGFGHKAKGISMTAFAETDVKALEEGGNRKARKLWLARLEDHPIRDESPVAKVQAFMVRVYTKKDFYSEHRPKDGHRLKKSPASNSRSRRSRTSHSTTNNSRHRHTTSHKAQTLQQKVNARASSRTVDRDDDSTEPSESESSSDFSSSYPSEGERDGSLSSVPTSAAATPRQAPSARKQASTISTQSVPAKAEATGDNSPDLLDTLMGCLSMTETATQPKRNQSAPNGSGGSSANKAPSTGDNQHGQSPALDSMLSASQNGAQRKRRSPLSIQRSVKLEQATTRLVGLFAQVQEHFTFSDDELKEACKTALVSLVQNGHPHGPPAVPIATGYLYPNSMSGPSTEHYAAMARGGVAGPGAVPEHLRANGGGGGLGANSQGPTPRHSMLRNTDPSMFDAPRQHVQELDSNNPFAAAFESPIQSMSPVLEQQTSWQMAPPGAMLATGSSQHHTQNGFQDHDANFFGANDLFRSGASNQPAASAAVGRRGSKAQENHGIPDAFSAFSNGLAPALNAQRSSVTSDGDASNPFEF